MAEKDSITSTSLATLLFDGLPGHQNLTPLFATQIDLAKAICELKETPFTGRPEPSVRSLINQVLNGHKPMSDDLRAVIQQAAKARLQRAKGGEDLARLIEEGVRRFSSKSVKQSVPLSAEEIWRELRRAGDEALVHYVVTFEPAETKTSEKAELLRSDLVDSLCLPEILVRIREDKSSAVLPVSRRQYRFHLPEATAFMFWTCLLGYLCKSKGWDRENAISVLERMESEGEDARLQVFSVPEYLTSLPYVVFDPGSPSCRGFVLFYHGEDGVSPAKISSEALGHWRQNVYRPLEDPRNEFRKMRVLFTDALEAIRKGENRATPTRISPP
jgi:hypothetical protein